MHGKHERHEKSRHHEWIKEVLMAASASLIADLIKALARWVYWLLTN